MNAGNANTFFGEEFGNSALSYTTLNLFNNITLNHYYITYYCSTHRRTPSDSFLYKEIQLSPEGVYTRRKVLLRECTLDKKLNFLIQETDPGKVSGGSEACGHSIPEDGGIQGQSPCMWSMHASACNFQAEQKIYEVTILTVP